MKYLLSILLIISILSSKAQDNSEFDKKKFNKYLIGTGLVYGATLVGLQALWYSQSEQRSFHFFNDNAQWKQVDKVGHLYSSYQLGRISYELLNNSGIPRKKAIFWGGMTGFLLLTPIEILDGFAADYGASYGDLIANGIGTGLLMSQLYLWDELRIKPKFSFHRTRYAPLNPGLLGNGLQEEIIKDYNGQTYWLSFDISSFTHSKSNILKWVNLAVGYGAEDMLSSRDSDNKMNGFHPYRQFYLGIDPDLSHLKSDKKFWNTILFVLDGFKIPGPTLIFQKNDVLFRPLYF